MENLKNVAPIEDFNWDAYENGESFAGASHEELAVFIRIPVEVFNRSNVL